MKEERIQSTVHPILVALDGSPREELVLATAMQIAAALESSLLLLRAVHLPIQGIPELALEGDDLGAQLERHASEGLAAAARRVPPERLAGTRTVIGVPWQAICDVAEKEQASLIVVGAHGHGALDRLLGTTATRVVNHAERSVLVVRAPIAL